MQLFYVCVLTDRQGRLTVDLTRDLKMKSARALQEPIRKYDHKGGEGSDDWKYKLIYFECFQQSDRARSRKRDINSWKNEKLQELIRFVNPEHYDLSIESKNHN